MKKEKENTTPHHHHVNIKGNFTCGCKVSKEEKKWVKFIEVSDSGKTKVWELYNTENEHFLGVVKWYGGFRKYVFCPANDSMYAPSCLREVARFIDTEMFKRNLSNTL